MRRAIGYLRVSTNGQQERGAGLETQRRKVKEYATGEGLTLLAVVAETASGAIHQGELSSIEHRPVLSDLLEQAQRGEYDVLLVSSFDRLSRDQVDAQLIKRWFSKYGVSCVSAAGESNGAEGPIAELIDRILGAIHDFDRKRILERLRAGKEAKKRDGRFVHGGVPYGYTTERGLLTPHAARSEIVRRIFAEACEGGTPGKIAASLNRDEIPGPRGGSWNRTTVRRIIENVAYTGELYGVKRAHPAVISRRNWNTANAVLRGRARRASQQGL